MCNHTPTAAQILRVMCDDRLLEAGSRVVSLRAMVKMHCDPEPDWTKEKRLLPFAALHYGVSKREIELAVRVLKHLSKGEVALEPHPS